MINHISIIGILRNIDEANDIIRYIEVKRNYKNNLGQYDSDCFPCIMWSRNNKNQLFSYREGTLVAIEGRLEIEEKQMYIIIETITYLLSNEANVNTRGS